MDIPMKKLFSGLFVALSISSAAAQTSGLVPSGQFLGNNAASSKPASPSTGTALFDRAFGATDNSILRRSGTWGTSQTLPNAVQDNITRLGTIVAGPKFAATIGIGNDNALYPVTCDGTDDTTALAAAATAAQASGLTILLPLSTCVVANDAALLFTTGNVTVLGQGPGSIL